MAGMQEGGHLQHTNVLGKQHGGGQRRKATIHTMDRGRLAEG